MRKRKKYRTIIIDLRKAGKKFSVFLFLIIFAVGALLDLSPKDKINNIYLKNMFKNIVKNQTEIEKNILKSEMPFFKTAEKTALWALSEEKAEPVYNPENIDKENVSDIDEEENVLRKIKEIDSSQRNSLSGSDKKILLKNETGFNVDVSSMLKEDLPFALDLKGPEVLIIHTHATESYAEEGVDSSKSERTTDTEKNVVKVGEKMAEIFREKGIETLHIKTLHDYPNYNGSYQNSLESAEEMLKKYPSIKIIIDVHRDAIIYSDGSKAKVLCEINGKKAAQLMFVIGTDAGGLNHPNWRKNLAFAVKLQSAIEQKYPGLMRGINLRKERFNAHLTTGSVILEVGTNGNTLSEAIYGATLFASAAANYIK